MYSVSVYVGLHSYKVHPNTLNSSGVMEYTQNFVKKKTDAKMSKVKKMQMEIIKKASKLELSILCTVCLFTWVYIPTRYHPNILNSLSYRAYTKNCEKMQREITRKVSKLVYATCVQRA